MAAMSETAFQAHLKTKEPMPVYLIYGEETHLVRWYARQTERMVLGGEIDPLNHTTFAFEDADPNAVIAELEVLSFGLRRCVKLADVQADGMKKEQAEKWRPVLEAASDTAVLVMVCADRPVDYAKSAGWKHLTNLVEKMGGAVLYCGKKTPAQLKKYLIDRVAKQGATLPPELADRILAGGITDLLTLTKEADKLAAWCGEGGVITKDAIEQLTPLRPEATVYQMAGELCKGNASGLKRLELLLRQGVEPTYLIAVLGGTFVDLYRGRLALDQGVNAQQMATDFAYAKNREFVVRNAMRDCQNYSLEQLRRAVTACEICEAKMKSSGLDAKLLLQQLSVELLTQGNV